MAEKKKLWKRWYMIVLYVFVGLMLLSMIFSGNKEPTTINEVDNNQGDKATTSNYIIEVTGTEGIEFTGSIGGGANARTVEGSIPSTYEVSDWPAVAVIQKKGASGTLTVTMKKNGRILNTQTTDADYGVVTVSS